MTRKTPARVISFEGERLEYKLTVDRRILCKEIVALANTKGGKIIIGIGDDRAIVGAGKLTADGVANMARDVCVPPLTPKIEREERDGKEIITVTVNPDGEVPYRTKQGIYHIRVGATVRTATVRELIGLIAKGPHSNTMQFKARMPQLQSQIRESMLAGAGFDQALMGIAALLDLAENGDESVQMEVVNTVGELLEVRCSNDKVIRRLLNLLVSLTTNDSTLSQGAASPSRALFGRVIEIMKQVLDRVTRNPEVTNMTVDAASALHFVGVGCVLSNYDDELEKVMEAINSNCLRSYELTKLGRYMTTSLEEFAAEIHSHTKADGAVEAPFANRSSDPAWFSWFRRLLKA